MFVWLILNLIYVRTKSLRDQSYFHIFFSLLLLISYYNEDSFEWISFMKAKNNIICTTILFDNHLIIDYHFLVKKIILCINFDKFSIISFANINKQCFFIINIKYLECISIHIKILFYRRFPFLFILIKYRYHKEVKWMLNVEILL